MDAAQSKYHSLISTLLVDEHSDQYLLNLCAYDNVLSQTARHFLKSSLGFRYQLGSISERLKNNFYHKKDNFFLRKKLGLETIESEAHSVAIKLFGGVSADFRPLSGVHAMMCSILALTKPGDIIFSFNPADGGHFATNTIAKASNRQNIFLPWDDSKQDIDHAALKNLMLQYSPSMIFLDHGCPQRPLDLKNLRNAVNDDVIIIYDASHSLGLIAGGFFQSPLTEGCNILQANTHKSFPGPQKGIFVFADEEIAFKVTSALDQGFVSSQHTNHLIALCITMFEMEEWGDIYAEKMIANATSLKMYLQDLGLKVLYPDDNSTHIILLDVETAEKGEVDFQRLLQAGISTNFKIMGNKTIIRIGTQEITRKGLEPFEMLYLADLLYRAIEEKTPLNKIRCEVETLMKQSQQIYYSFDDCVSISEAMGV